LFKSLGAFGREKAVAALVGMATAVVTGLVVPLVAIVFSQYDPLLDFLSAYWQGCVVILALSCLSWFLMLRQDSFGINVTAHVVAAVSALSIEALMRHEVLPGMVFVQFVLYFAGVVLLCETLLIGVARVALRAVRIVSG
jgi:hypothetical protein